MFRVRHSKPPPVRRPILHFKCQYDSATRYRHLLSPCAYCRAKAWRRVRFHLSGTYDPKPDPLPPATPDGNNEVSKTDASAAGLIAGQITGWNLQWPRFLHRAGGSLKRRGSTTSTTSGCGSDSELDAATDSETACDRSYELVLRYNHGWREWLLEQHKADECPAAHEDHDALRVGLAPPGHHHAAEMESRRTPLASCDSFQTACEMWEL